MVKIIYETILTGIFKQTNAVKMSMKKTKTWILIATVLLSFSVSAPSSKAANAQDPSLGNIVRLTSSEYSDVPDIASFSDNVYIVWSKNELVGDGYIRPDDIFFRKSADNGVSFSDAVNLSDNHGLSDHPAIAAYNNNVYVVWQDDSKGDKEILFRKSTDNGANFEPTINLSNNSGDSESPEIIASGSNVYIIWRDSSPGNFDIFFKATNDYGASFGSTINLSNNKGNSWNQESREIAVSDNNVYVVWQDESYERLEILFRRSTDNGASFEPVVNVSDSSGVSHHPAIAVSGSNVYVVWNDDTDTGGHGENYGVFFRKSTDSGATFDPSINLSNNGKSGFPKIAAYGNYVYVGWTGIFPDGGMFFARSVDSGATFDSEINLTNVRGLADQATIILSASTVCVVWRNNNDIFFSISRDSGQIFEKSVNLSNNGNSFYPKITLSSNSLYVLWIDDWKLAFRAATIQTTSAAASSIKETAKISIGSVSNPAPRWDLDAVTISGMVTNAMATDLIEVDWGDGSSNVGISHSNGSWDSVSHTYSSRSVGTNEITVKLLGTNGVEKASAEYTVVVQKHATSIKINPINSVESASYITVEGSLVDTGTGKGISSGIVTFNGTGATDLAAATNNGIRATSTSGEGTFSAIGKSPNNDASGWTVQAHFGGDDLYLASDSNIVTYDTLTQVISEPTKRVKVSDIDIVDIVGNKLSEISVGKQLQIQSYLESGQSNEQSLAYIVQIKDEHGRTIFLSWIKGSIQNGQSLKKAVAWTPDLSGNYTVKIFVWDNVINPQPLSEVSKIEITVN